MSENSVLRPVGCEATESFVLQPLVGLLESEPLAKERPLWRDYWSEGELCIFTGDTGAGKTLLALNLARELATGDEVIAPSKVLYVGHEYDKRGFVERFGKPNETAAGNFFFAVFNHGQSGLYSNYAVFKDWLLEGLVKLLDKTQATVLIFDQPDRLQLSNMQWIDFLNVVEVLRRERKLSVLLVVNTRTRNTARPVELYQTYKHQFTTPFADCVVAICRSHQYPQQRYIKHLKCKNRMWELSGRVSVFEILEDRETHHLSLEFMEHGKEHTLLPRSKEKERRDKVMTAEAFRREGVSFRKIGELLDLPESTIRSWVGSIDKENPFERPDRGSRWYPGMTSKNESTYNINEHPVALAEQEAKGYFDDEGNFVEGRRGDSSSEIIPPPPVGHPLQEGDNYLRLGDEINTPHLSVAEVPLCRGDFDYANAEQNCDGLLRPVGEEVGEKSDGFLVGGINVRIRQR